MSVGAVNKQTGDRIPTAGMPAIDSVLSGTSTNPVQNRVVKEALDGITDGQSIDSFADVESALSNKQNTLTFDDVPTDNSNNPVKSNGIYDALSDKANTDIVASDFDATASYTAGNYCIYEGKFYKFKNNHTGAWSASDVDEIKIAGELAAKQNVTDNSLNTTDKTVPGAINELKSGLIDVTGRTRNNITSRLSNLSTAVAEQNLEKYGYAIGDYFVGASGYIYILADMDTYYGGYNNSAIVNTHHVSLVVKTGANSKWAETDDTSGGYKTSTLHSYLSSTVLDNIKADMIALFGGSTGLEHLVSHKLLWTTATSAWAWSDNAEYISALSEPQVYGTNVWAIDGYQTGEAWKWLDVFHKFNFCEIIGNIWWWLRSISSASYACDAYSLGHADHSGASYSGGAVGLIIFH